MKPTIKVTIPIDVAGSTIGAVQIRVSCESEAIFWGGGDLPTVRATSPLAFWADGPSPTSVSQRRAVIEIMIAMLGRPLAEEAVAKMAAVYAGGFDDDGKVRP